MIQNQVVLSSLELDPLMKSDLASNLQSSLLSSQHQLITALRLLNSSLDVICSVDRDGRFVNISAASKNVWGYEPAELIGKKCLDFILEEDHLASVQAGQQIRSGKNMTYFENRYCCKDGSIVPIVWSAHWDAREELMYCVAKDGREKVKMEEELNEKKMLLCETVDELHEKNRRLQEINDLVFLGDMIPQIIFVSDAEGNAHYQNQRWYEYTGLGHEPTKDSGWMSAVHPEDLPLCQQKWSVSCRTGQDYEVEHRLRRASDGQYRWHLARARAYCDENGNILKWFGTSTDIHDNKLLQEQLEKNNAEITHFRNIAIEEVQKKSQFLNGVLRNLPVIVFRLDENGITTDSMGSGLQLVGLKEGEAVGMNAFVAYPQMKERVQEMRLKGLNEFESVNMVNGNEVLFQMYLFPDENNPNAVVSFGLDITEKKKAERSLEKAKLQAEVANKFKTRFLASMSHEIRTPLNAILGFAGILKTSDLSREDSLQYLDYIESSGALLLKLIGDVLDMSKIEEGKLTIRQEPFQFRQTMEELITPYQFKAREKGVVLSLNISDKVPASLIGDAYRLNQIIINLLGNALKFTREGNIDVDFDIAKQKQKTPGNFLLQLKVQDSGIGIPSGRQSSIFESFTQADDSIVKEFGGSGLGLSITTQLIALMGGSIIVESPVMTQEGLEQGSLFTVEIPMKVGQHVAEKRQPDGELNTYVFSQQVQVLVAEDNELNQRLASFMLDKMGCEADIANNGLEAIELIKTKSYDVILMDVQMPLMDGFTATRMIRTEFDKNIPIIGLTASVFREDIEQCLQAGMSDHMGKPYDQAQLYKMIEKWYSRRN